jgi:hypothetical protein
MLLADFDAGTKEVKKCVKQGHEICFHIYSLFWDYCIVTASP